LSIHEYAHGKVAQLQGDNTAGDFGRLTLNPLAHIDPIGTILVPLVLLVSSGGRIGFGWARPVPVNPNNFRSPRQGVLLVSFAGPAANLGLALMAGLLLRGVGVGPADGLMLSFWLILRSIVFINLFLAFFNLIPIPPLDGSGILSAILPLEYARKYDSVGRYGPVLLIGLIAIGWIGGVSIIGLIAGIPASFLYFFITGQPYFITGQPY
jgi:Zn-dependent protease